MNTNRKIISACIASMLLIATGVSAQTIYKQVDGEGRVIFTDQPAPGARTVTSIDTSRPRAQAPVENGEWASRMEASRRPMPRIVEPAATEAPARTDDSARRVASEEALRRIAPGSEAPRRYSADVEAGRATDVETGRRIAAPIGAPRMGEIVTPKRSTQIAATNVQLQYPNASVSRGGYVDAERAATTYTALNTPLAAQADATEAARRARQDVNKANGGAILVVQAAPRDHEPAVKKSSGMDSFYLIWAATFFALAAGLLYVGWYVIRLILGTAFPRWQVGTA